jgi:hypothetical protein
MGVSWKFEEPDAFQGASEFTAGEECSHRQELGPHYHIEIEREQSAKGIGYADVAVVLSVEQAREL